MPAGPPLAWPFARSGQLTAVGAITVFTDREVGRQDPGRKSLSVARARPYTAAIPALGPPNPRGPLLKESSMSFNRVILLGRLGRDPEVRYAQSGTAIATLNLATDGRRPDGNGGWKNETEWHRVVLFGKLADLAKQYLTKGREVMIEGELRTRQWQDKEGQKRFTTEIVANNMRFVGGRGGSGAGGPGAGDSGVARGGEDMGATGAPVGGGADDFGASDFGGGGGPDDDLPF